MAYKKHPPMHLSLCCFDLSDLRKQWFHLSLIWNVDRKRKTLFRHTVPAINAADCMLCDKQNLTGKKVFSFFWVAAAVSAI